MKFIINNVLMFFSMRFMYKKLCGSGVATSRILYKAPLLSCKLLRLGKALKSFFSNSISLKFLTLKKNGWVAFTLINVFSALSFCTEVVTKMPLGLALTCAEFSSFDYLAILDHLLSHLKLQVSDTILQTYRFLLYSVVWSRASKTVSNFSGKNSSKKHVFLSVSTFISSFVHFLTGSHTMSTFIEGDPCIFLEKTVLETSSLIYSSVIQIFLNPAVW